MKDAETICYLYLMEHVLTKLNNLNLFFQQSKVILHKIEDKVVKTFKDIVSCVINREYVIRTPASDIDLFDASNYLQIVDFELGSNIREIFTTNGKDMQKFAQYSFNFVIIVCLEMKLKFNNFKNESYEAFQCLHPINALSENFREKRPYAFSLFKEHFQNIIDADVPTLLQMEREWNDLPNVKVNQEDLKKKV